MYSFRPFRPFLLLILRELFEEFFIDCASESCMLPGRYVSFAHAVVEYWVNEVAIQGPPDIVCSFLTRLVDGIHVSSEFRHQDGHGVGGTDFELRFLRVHFVVLVSKTSLDLLKIY